MCTLIVARNIFEGFPIVVAANRDELLDRPSEAPKLRNNGRVLAPKDLLRGGTWNGVNNAGLFVGITNRIDVESQGDRISRGEVVDRALRANTAYQALMAVMVLKGSDLNGFHLVVADRQEAYLLKGDGGQIAAEPVEDGLLVVTNHGVGREVGVETPPRVNAVLRVWHFCGLAACQPTPADLHGMLDIHGDWRYGTCIHQPEENYGTKSSSVIRLDAAQNEWQYWHRQRTSNDRHVCTEPFGKANILPILTSHAEFD